MRHTPGRYRDYREKYALTTGEGTARYCENITNPTVQPDGKTDMHTPIPDVAHVEQSKAYQVENQLYPNQRTAALCRLVLYVLVKFCKFTGYFWRIPLFCHTIL